MYSIVLTVGMPLLAQYRICKYIAVVKHQNGLFFPNNHAAPLNKPSSTVSCTVCYSNYILSSGYL